METIKHQADNIKENIEIISEINIPQIIPWNSSDIAILFANVLENAINASSTQQKGNKKIWINTRYDDSKLVIIVKNRFDGDILFNEVGLPISLKSDHGMGMSSVSAIVSKYNAYMVCSNEEGWFNINFIFCAKNINRNNIYT